MWNVNRCVRRLQNSMARTLLPTRFKRGDQTQMPIKPGTTTMTAPLTLDLAGSPIEYANSPLSSYMPQLNMADSVLRTTSTEKTRSRVTGCMPRLAKVAATAAM